MKASIKNLFAKQIMSCKTKVYNNESNELGLKYHGGDEGLLQEMVGCENLSFYWSFYNT